MRRWVTWITLVCFVTTQTAAVAGPFEEGTAAGQAANPVIRGTVNTPSASSAVPGYTTTPPETTYYSQPSLSGAANARLAACATSIDDPVCQAQRGAVTSANTPRTPVSAYDPAVAAARDIAGNPSSVLGSLADYYSGCTTAEVTTPAGTTTKVCNRYSGVGNYTTRRDLTVQVELLPSCTEGTWFAHGQVNRNGMDYMIAEAQCRIRADGKQRFRFYAAGGMGACIGWQALDLPIAPATQATYVTDLSPHWQGYCWSPFKVVMMPGSGCTAGSCSYTFQFGTPVYACPAGTVRGDTLSGYWAGEFLSGGAADQCFTLTAPDAEAGCPGGSTTIYDDAGTHCALPAGSATLVGASGWSLPLSFVQPTMEQHETDVWVDRSAALTESGRCTVTTADRCVDGPATKTIDGRAVTRACWSYERTLTCASGAPVDECAPLASSGCTPATSTCKQMNAATGLCEITQDTYTCPVSAQTATTASDCPANVYCLGSNCFNTSYTNDADFARSMSLMEAAREAGVYLDTDNMQVFKGESNKCRDRLFKNCCYSDSAGAGMTNQSLFGTGSRLVYDVLMNADNREFLYQGMQALLLGGGFSGSFTTYGVTVAINGTALPAGSAVLYAGDGLVIAFDPWSLAIAVVIYIVMSMSSCNEDEGKLAMKEGAGLCHSVGTYCSSCIRILGACVACIEHTTGKCCFNSKLARIVNEQGRVQVGKCWGSGKNPDCSGFTIAQLQSLDFAAMDLSEFYASIVPTLPSVGTIQGSNASRLTTCYYGQGKC
ncbi:MAG: conjugal transfer protein TraN [Candidatus Accumulibacter sp. 66-26]|nr:type-F conjugative transfer system mating-pair stabilization protein TraN [Accumulibacter sp.]OJW50044.1 MAG: conjugal transfer protein TraN [Candidatus Accumulibacter sp. 66-26]